jgi:signal peptidase II
MLFIKNRQRKKMQNKISIPALVCLGLIVDFIILDQLTKWLILEYVFRPQLGAEPLGLITWFQDSARLPLIRVELTSFFNLTMVWNEGVSFGLFQNGNPWPLIIIALTISAVFTGWLVKTETWRDAIPLAMVIGGALGNVIDRLHFGAVADFFDFHLMGWHYPAFNIADSLISVGIVILIVNSLFFSSDKKE